MDIVRNSSIKLFPNELLHAIFKLVELKDLKNLRLVDKKWNENSKLILCLNYDSLLRLDDKYSVDKFLNAMCSVNFPFRSIRLKIETYCDTESVEFFFQKFALYVSECNFSFYKQISTTELIKIVESVIVKCFKLKKFIYEHAVSLSQNENLKIVLPPSVESISVKGEDVWCGSNHDCLGNGVVSVISFIKLNSSPTLEARYHCPTCVASMLEETVGKGFKEICLRYIFSANASNTDAIMKISQITNPSPRIFKMRMIAPVRQDRIYFEPMDSLFKMNEKNIESLQIYDRGSLNSAYNFEIPKLQQLRELTLSTLNLTCTLNCTNLINLKFLCLKTYQVSEICPISTKGNFPLLSNLVIDASMLSFISFEQWVWSFTSVKSLKIIISTYKEERKVPESLKILKEFINLRHIKIQYTCLQTHYDKNLGLKRWTGINLSAAMHKNRWTRNLTALCELRELSTLKVFGLCSCKYGRWVNALIYLTLTEELKALSYIVLSTSYTHKTPKDKLYTEEQYNVLATYHKRVQL